MNKQKKQIFEYIDEHYHNEKQRILEFLKALDVENSNKLQSAVLIALAAHCGQKDKAGAAYIFHPLTVATYCEGERARLAAILHDVVEDSNATLADILLADVDLEIIDAVDCLTKHPQESISEYLVRVASNPIATEVKYADMRHNCDTSRWDENQPNAAQASFMKYCERIRALRQLTSTLPHHPATRDFVFNVLKQG